MKAIRTRGVILTIDTIAELFKDYIGGEDVPEDAMAVKLMFKPTEQGKLALLMVSDSFPADAAPLQATFNLKRLYSV